MKNNTKEINDELEKNMKTIIRMKVNGDYPVGDAFGAFAEKNKDFLDGYDVKTSGGWTAFGYRTKIEVKRK